MFLDFECLLACLLACLREALVGRKSEERRLYVCMEASTALKIIKR